MGSDLSSGMGAVLTGLFKSSERPSSLVQLGLVVSAWWGAHPGTQSQLPSVPPRGAPTHPGWQQGGGGQPALPGWWCRVSASPTSWPSGKSAMCSDKWRVNGAPGQGEAPRPDAAWVTWGGGPPDPPRPEGASSSLPAGASISASRRWGARPGLSSWPLCGVPGGGGGGVCGPYSGVSKAACWGS